MISITELQRVTYEGTKVTIMKITNLIPNQTKDPCKTSKKRILTVSCVLSTSLFFAQPLSAMGATFDSPTSVSPAGTDAGSFRASVQPGDADVTVSPEDTASVPEDTNTPISDPGTTPENPAPDSGSETDPNLPEETTPDPALPPDPGTDPAPDTDPGTDPANPTPTPTPGTGSETEPTDPENQDPEPTPGVNSESPAPTPDPTPLQKPAAPVPETNSGADDPGISPSTNYIPGIYADHTPISFNWGDYADASFFQTIDKDYALAKVETFVNIHEEKNISSRVVGRLNRGGMCFVIADKDQPWVYVESGEVRGFILREYLMMDEDAHMQVDALGENKFSLAECMIAEYENKAYRYSPYTVREVEAGSEVRSSLLKFSQQFLGHPYVWGGVSLTDGADCSGYVMQVFKRFGYSLPRTSREQAYAGTRIPAAEAKPGDLIFYARPNGTIYHVMIYMGDGKAINAQSTKTGIVISNVDYAKVPWAVRVIEDQNAMGVNPIFQLLNQGRAKQSGIYLGRFKLTAYCSCPICCGKWSKGPTASGRMPVQGRTVAVGGIGFGTKLNIGGQVFTVEDRGTPYGHIDIYMNSHEEAKQFGVQYADVYVPDNMM